MAVIRNASISFHTNNDDKDVDTHVTITLVDEDGVVAAPIDNNFGHFDDNIDSGAYALIITNPSAKTSLQSGKIIIRIDPNGHHTSRFSLYLSM
jgi:hypothetical protein